MLKFNFLIADLSVAKEGVKFIKKFGTTPIPYVAFGDTVSPPPPECNLLFEWHLKTRVKEESATQVILELLLFSSQHTEKQRHQEVFRKQNSTNIS